ncbi:MAG: hypothetical protein ABI228_02355 [Burkholderiaceae bacterium]
MTCVEQWPAQRPFWVVLLSAALGLAVLSSVGYCFFGSYAVLAALWPAWRLGQHFRSASCAAKVQLCAGPAGGWEVNQPGKRLSLVLIHAWPAFAWVTLRFRDVDATSPKDTMLEITIWKSSVSPDAWRRLNVLVASQLGTHQFVAASEAQ